MRTIADQVILAVARGAKLVLAPETNLTEGTVQNRVGVNLARTFDTFELVMVEGGFALALTEQAQIDLMGFQFETA